MARVETGDREFFEGLAMFQRGMSALAAQRAQERELELQEKIMKTKIEQANQDFTISNINAKANFLNALNQSGFIKNINQDKLKQVIPEIAEFQAGVPRQTLKGQQALEAIQERGKQAREIESLKQKGKQEVIEQKGKVSQQLAQTKLAGAEKLQRQKLITEQAKFGLTPSDLAGAAVSFEEIEQEQALRPGEDVVIAIPRQIAGITIGKQNITANDLINALGTAELTADLIQEIKEFNEALKQAPKAKDQIIDKMIELHPELGQLLGR